MRLIDADALLDLIHDSTILTDGFVATMTAIIAGEPTVYPERTDVVQCKDCKRSGKCFREIHFISDNGVFSFKLTDYCSIAERRTDEAD